MRVSRETYKKHVRTYPPGEIIFRENESGNEMFVVIEGKVEITKSTSSGSAKALIELGAGDLFGEMAIIEKKSRSATATALTASRLLVLDEALFENTLHANPDFARKMIKVLSERLRRANTILLSVLATNRENQVMDALGEFAAEFGMPTFKGERVNIEQFVSWACAHIGLAEQDIRQHVQALVKRKILQESALGEDEVIVNKRGLRR